MPEEHENVVRLHEVPLNRNAKRAVFPVRLSFVPANQQNRRSKLIPVFQTGGAGSFPVVHFRRHGAMEAQLICNQPAAGSNPADGFAGKSKHMAP